MEFGSVTATWVIDIFLLLLIGIGPKIAWCRSSRRLRACPQRPEAV
jgi:hypothetical protein